MVGMGFIPALHFLAFLAALVLPPRYGHPRLAWLSLAVLFVAPPLVVRTMTAFRPLPDGRFDVNSGAFLAWWFSAQWQVIFNRLPFLEELLRLFPGLYSLWLRCWGARVGRLVYWSPGLVILDRPLLHVGDRVVFGAGVRVNAHVLLPQGKQEGNGDGGGGTVGRMTLAVARVRIGSDVMVGGYSLLLAGATVADGQVTAPLRTLAPFTHWKDGRRLRDPAAEDAS
jgi:hypothetical protein